MTNRLPASLLSAMQMLFDIGEKPLTVMEYFQEAGTPISRTNIYHHWDKWRSFGSVQPFTAAGGRPKQITPYMMTVGQLELLTIH